MAITVIDDILPTRLVQELAVGAEHKDCPWQYSGATYGTEEVTFRKNEMEESQYVHVAFYEGDATYLWPLYHTPLYFLEKELGFIITNIQRCKINCLSVTPAYSDTMNHPVHPDRKDDNWYSAIYYVNGGDGDTVFTNKKYPYLEDKTNSYDIVKRVAPKQGRFVIFPSQLYHASSPTTVERRIVANYVFQMNNGAVKNDILSN